MRKEWVQRGPGQYWANSELGRKPAGAGGSGRLVHGSRREPHDVTGHGQCCVNPSVLDRRGSWQLETRGCERQRRDPQYGPLSPRWRG